MAAPGAQGAYGRIVSINPKPNWINGINILDRQHIYGAEAEAQNILNALNYYSDYFVLKAFRHLNNTGEANYNDELRANNLVRSILHTPIPAQLNSILYTEYKKYLLSIVSLSLNSQQVSIVGTKLNNTYELYRIGNEYPVIIMLKLGINNLGHYRDTPAINYPELDGGITTKTFLDLVNKFNFFGTFFATTDAHFGNIMFTNKFIQELNIIDIGLARDVLDINSVRIPPLDLARRIRDNDGFDNFAIEDVIHEPNRYSRGQIVAFLNICHQRFRNTCGRPEIQIHSPYFDDDASFNASMPLIYNEFTQIDPQLRHYIGMRTKDLYIFGMWILYNRRGNLFSNDTLMNYIGALLMHPNPLLRPNTTALRKLLDQVIKPSRHTVEINVNRPRGGEYILCTVENRIEGTVNINISNILQNITPHIDYLFNDFVKNWDIVSYTSLILQLYSILRQPGGPPIKTAAMIIDKRTHLRLNNEQFEYTVYSMSSLVNNLSLAELTQMERFVINYFRDEVRRTQPWIVNTSPFEPSFTTPERTWYPVLGHDPRNQKIIGNPGTPIFIT